MQVKEEKLLELKTLGFEERTDDNKTFYYEKNIGFGCKIVVGEPYVESTNVSFHHRVGYWGDTEEITACVPIWAFPTMVKMVQMGFVDED